MRRSSCSTAPAALAAAAILVLPVAAGGLDDPPPPPIKTIMETLNKGPEALTSSIGRNLDRADPDWKTLTRQCEEYVENVEHLGKNVPPRGEPASWERLSKAYLDDAKAMALAVEMNNRKAALAAHHKVEQACARCHVVHKP